MPLLEHFPPPFAPRQIQREILGEIESCLESGYKKIVLCAPTGVGKSLVGLTVSRRFGSSFTVTASKHLQDQYVRDAAFLKPVKGKQNFACLKMMEEDGVAGPKRAVAEGLTCEKGQCQERRTVAGKETVEVCKFKPSISQVAEGSHDQNACYYYLQKYEALTAPHSLWNYHAFFQVMRYNKKLFADYLQREAAVFDEAHKIEDQIIQFVGFDVLGWQAAECNLPEERYDLGDLDSVAQLIDDIAYSYARQIRDLKESPGFGRNPDYDALAKLEHKHGRAFQAKLDIASDRGNFVVNKPLRGMDGRLKSVSVRPVDVSKFTGEFFEAQHQLFMSATIDAASFCENMGLDADKVAFVDAPKSPFPAENRSVEMLNVRQLSYGSTEQDELAVIAEIDRILGLHSGERGLVLTSSVYRCRKILENLSPENARRVRICHSSNSGKTQDEVLSEHGADPQGVLLSSSLWEGVDLKGGLSRFQVIAKVPYPNYTEARTKAKMARFPSWYTSQTVTKLLQGFGRSVRSEDDWAKTYVLDGAVRHLLFKAEGMIPRAYHDVLGIDP